jgi:hypothetical protein
MAQSEAEVTVLAMAAFFEMEEDIPGAAVPLPEPLPLNAYEASRLALGAYNYYLMKHFYDNECESIVDEGQLYGNAVMHKALELKLRYGALFNVSSIATAFRHAFP